MGKELLNFYLKYLQEAGGIVVELEALLSEQQKIDTKAQSNINSKKDSLKAEQKKLAQTKKQINQVYSEASSTIPDWEIDAM